ARHVSDGRTPPPSPAGSRGRRAARRPRTARLRADPGGAAAGNRLGGGGYVSGPMVYAASRRRLPTALMEADAYLGFANRLAAPFARRVFLSFPIAGRDGPRYLVTGRPIPERSRALAQAEGRRIFGLPEVGPVLLVFG